MSNDMYIAASGGLYALRKLEIVANNLANVDTVGFKAERMVSRQQEFKDTLAQQIGKDGILAQKTVEETPGVLDISTVTDFSQGPINSNGNPLNVALTKENQFFSIQTPDGVTYTRAGNFTLNNEGTLVTPDGLPVLGDGGVIALPPDGKPAIASNGAVSVDGQLVGRIRVVEIEQVDKLERTEGVRFRLLDGDPQEVPPELVVGAVEMPNVSAVTSVVDMIGAQRSFEAYTKVVRAADELNDQAIRNAGSS